MGRLSEKQGQQLPSGKIWLGDASNVSQPVTLSGDVTVDNAGVMTVAAAKVSSTWELTRAALGSTYAIETTNKLYEITTGTPFTSGVTYYWALDYLKTGKVLTGFKWYSITAGVYVSTNANMLALYKIDSSGLLTQAAPTADDPNIFKTAANTFGSKAFASTYTAAAGQYFIGVIRCESSSTTNCSFGGATAWQGGLLTAGDFANGASLMGYKVGQTSLPSTVAMSTLTKNGSTTRPWFAVY